MSAMRVGAGIAAVVWTFAALARGQAREPLCRAVETLRVSADRRPAQNLGESVVALPIAGRDGAAFVVVWREARTPGEGGAVLRYARVGSELRVRGAVGTVVVPGAERDEGTGALSGARVGDGALVLFRAGAVMHAITIGADGAVSPTRTLVTERAVEAGATAVRTQWSTAASRGDGAVALVGASDGSVQALRFDRAGMVQGQTAWIQRVGGVMRLLPVREGGPVAAMLERPLPGVGPDGEQPAVQMLVTLDERLLPVGVPERTGFAQFAWSAVNRGSVLELAQWVGPQGVALGRLPVTARRVALESPRLWFAQPPFGGSAAYAGALLSRDRVHYALTITERRGTALSEAHLAWVAPGADPVLRRNVVPVFGAALGAPALVPAEDGFVALVAHNDEGGFALDGFHVRCELVRRDP
jgi:hypothetical protein